MPQLHQHSMVGLQHLLQKKMKCIGYSNRLQHQPVRVLNATCVSNTTETELPLQPPALIQKALRL